MSTFKITGDLVKIVTETANDIVDIKGYFVHVSEDNTRLVLQALKIVKDAIDAKSKGKGK